MILANQLGLRKDSRKTCDRSPGVVVMCVDSSCDL